MRRNVHQLGAHVVEADRRLPEESVANEDPITPTRKPLTRERRQLLGDVESVRFDREAVLCRPTLDVLHQEAARATDVEKRAASMDCCEDWSTEPLPVTLVSSESG